MRIQITIQLSGEEYKKLQRNDSRFLRLLTEFVSNSGQDMGVEIANGQVIDGGDLVVLKGGEQINVDEFLNRRDLKFDDVDYVEISEGYVNFD
jgi:hypothetical protein